MGGLLGGGAEEEGEDGKEETVKWKQGKRISGCYITQVITM